MNTTTMKRNIYLLYGYYFFRAFIFAYAIERIFWRSRGMTVTDTVYIEFLYAGLIMLLELPSGMIADLWSRKRVIVLASILRLADMVILIFANSFAAFAMATSLSGTAGALSSGAINALLYDTLVEADKTEAFDHILGRIKLVRYAALGISAVIAGVVAQYAPLVLTYYMSAFSYLASLICALLLVEPARHQAPVKEDNTPQLPLRQSLTLLRAHPMLRQITLYGALVGGSIIYFEEFAQNYYDAVNIPLLWFGILSCVCSALVAFSGIKAHDLRRRFQSKPMHLYRGLLLVCAIGFISSSLVRSPLMVSFIFLTMAAASIMEIVSISDLHDVAASEYRATAESVYSFMLRGGSILFGILFSQLAKRSLFTGFFGIGVILAISWLGLQLVTANKLEPEKSIS